MFSVTPSPAVAVVAAMMKKRPLPAKPNDLKNEAFDAFHSLCLLYKQACSCPPYLRSVDAYLDAPHFVDIRVVEFQLSQLHAIFVLINQSPNPKATKSNMSCDSNIY